MRRMRSVMVGAWLVTLGAGWAVAAEPEMPAVDPKAAAMALAKQYGEPGDSHKTLDRLTGTWTFVMQSWMAPKEKPMKMTGTATNSWVFDGRFLKQEVKGQGEGWPSFEGVGYTGYDNMRREYQSVWLGNMGTGMHVATGQQDADGTMTEQGDTSCPMTGEAYRQFRAVWKFVDDKHVTYESYSPGPDGEEYKAMELQYTRK